MDGAKAANAPTLAAAAAAAPPVVALVVNSVS